MPHQSVDSLQRTLADSVFGYTTDRKKAAGRALGTLVEIITFYMLRAWGFRDNLVIERPVPEFANPSIVHNVEFSLHRVFAKRDVHAESMALPLTTAKLKRHVQYLSDMELKSTQLLSSDRVKRNSCVIREQESGIIVANLDSYQESNQNITLCSLTRARSLSLNVSASVWRKGCVKDLRLLKRPNKEHMSPAQFPRCRRFGYAMGNSKV